MGEEENMGSLDEILNDSDKKHEEKETKIKEEQTEKAAESATTETEVKEVAETPEAKEQRLRDEKGKFVSKNKETEQKEAKEDKQVKQEKETKRPEPEMSERERAFLAAAHDERIKRQALEKRLQELQKPTEEKSFWDDPESALKKFQDEMNGVVTNTRLNTAETIARSKYKDFDDQVQVFAGLLQQTPGLYQQWLNSQDPAEFAYNTGKKHREISQLGNLDAWKEQKEKEIRIKLEQEMKSEREEFEKLKSSIPGSLSDARSVVHNQPVFSGPTSLDSILKS